MPPKTLTNAIGADIPVEGRNYKAERDYLWAKLAEVEAWAAEAPDAVVARRIRPMLKAALDGFKPAVKSTRDAP